MEKTKHTVKEIRVEVLKTSRHTTTLRIHWDDIGLKDFTLYEGDTLNIDPTTKIEYRTYG